MTAPFDPEAEIASFIEETNTDGWEREHFVEARKLLRSALRRAYEAGTADMRERAARLFEVPYPEPETPMQAMVRPTLERLSAQSAAKVRALPLSPSERERT